MEFDVKKVIEELKSDKYPLFVSEADLQLRFAMVARDLYPELLFYPEYPQKNEQSDDHYDLVVFDDKNKEYCGIEFKYLVKYEEINVPGNKKFGLRKQSAVPKRKYHCLSDIKRLENLDIHSDYKKATSYFILISNEHKFWIKPGVGNIDEQFDFSEGILKKGPHAWREGCGTEKRTGSTIVLKYDHIIRWVDYFGNFKLLIIDFESNPKEISYSEVAEEEPIVIGKEMTVKTNLKVDNKPKENIKNENGPRVNIYYKLGEFFKTLKQDIITMTFAEVANKCGFDKLTDAAYDNRPWWANTLSHSQSIWLDYGYKVIGVDMKREVVTFQRI